MRLEAISRTLIAIIEMISRGILYQAVTAELLTASRSVVSAALVSSMPGTGLLVALGQFGWA